MTLTDFYKLIIQHLIPRMGAILRMNTITQTNDIANLITKPPTNSYLARLVLIIELMYQTQSNITIWSCPESNMRLMTQNTSKDLGALDRSATLAWYSVGDLTECLST